MANDPYPPLFARCPDLRSCDRDLRRAHQALVRGYRRGGKLLVAGNGGSFADALHICGELMKSFERRRPLPKPLAAALRRQPDGALLARELEAGLPAIALGASGSLATAVINDKPEPRLFFAQECLALGRRGDVFLGISTSGNARNVLLAMGAARAAGLTVIALTGTPGGRMAERAAIAIRAPGRSTAEVQEAHVRLYHALCAALEAEFFPARGR